MNVKQTEPTMGEILFWYIKGKEREQCQYPPQLPMGRYYAAKAQDIKGWDNMMWEHIDCNWNKCK